MDHAGGHGAKPGGPKKHGSSSHSSGSGAGATPILFFILVVGSYALFRNAASGPGADPSVAYTDQGHSVIAPGAPHPAYNSNPPTSGWYYAAPAADKFYTQPLLDETLVANLAKGDVWISYKPGLSSIIVSKLAAFAGPGVVVSPRTGDTADVMLAAWTRAEALNMAQGAIDTQQIAAFIKKYKKP